jgi:hypothetical protein
MHAALGFLLILTVHRCYPAGVPRCLQRNSIRQQISNHSQTLCLIWIFSILINLPLFLITKYEKYVTIIIDNKTNISETILMPACDTEATEIWSRTYLILLLVLTYFITGIFLIVIYGQVIRIILTSNKYANKNNHEKQNNSGPCRFLSPDTINQDKFREMSVRLSASSSTINRHQQQNSSSTLPISVIMSGRKNKRVANSRSIQHLQVIIMLFIVILLYILLLLPYRLFNLLYIVYNQLFQYNFINDILFHWLVNIVRLLVFLNCALQPIVYLIISSRLRQTVIKFLQSCLHQCFCQCQCSVEYETRQHCKTDNQVVHAYLYRKYQSTNLRRNKSIDRDHHRAVNNIHTNGCHSLTLLRQPMVVSYPTHKTPYTVTFTNPIRKK